MPSRSHPCEGMTVAGRRCTNTIANPAQRYCGKCVGAGQTAVLRETAVTTQSALRDLRERQVADDEYAVSGSTADALADRPTGELVGELRSRTSAALDAQVRAAALGRDNSPGAVAVRDQAQAARRDASRHEDAIMTRHNDPYGRALVSASWEAAIPSGDASEPERIRQWLAATPGAAPADIHLALNTLAAHDLGPAWAEERPWVDDLNRVAAYRAAFLHDPASIDQREVDQAEAQWRQVVPTGAR